MHSGGLITSSIYQDCLNKSKAREYLPHSQTNHRRVHPRRNLRSLQKSKLLKTQKQIRNKELRRSLKVRLSKKNKEAKRNLRAKP